MTNIVRPKEVAPGLDLMFAPRSVAVIGASEREDSVGRTVFWNLLRSPFGGPVYPINPRRNSVLGVRTVASVGLLKNEVDLAVIATPAATVPELIAECGEAGVRAAIILSAGFREVGSDGVALEKQVLENARRFDMRIIGPNCLGVMNPISGLNATFAAAMAAPGSIAFLSQSGALCTAVLDWSLRTGVGFSAFVSSGAMVDVGWGDLITHFGDDPRTKSIVLYMESIGDARSFLSAAREVALSKPVIAIKAGRTEAAAKAAASHTGAMAGTDEALDAAFRRAGVLRVNTIAELFYMAEILDKQPTPKGPNLTVITNAGGPGVLAADSLMLAGGKLTHLEQSTVAEMDKVLPQQWSHGNPVDVLGDAGADRYAAALDIAARDPNSDGLLVVLTPQAMTQATETAEKLKCCAKTYGKPLLASWMGGDEVAAGERLLNRAGIPTFPYPDTPARLFAYMWQHAQNLDALYETPCLVPGEHERPPDHAGVNAILDGVLKAQRTMLNEFESKSILAAYGIPVVQTLPATTEEEAVQIADLLGYPVALKLLSTSVTHKTDVGGVKLELMDSDDVSAAFRSIRENVATAAGEDAFNGVTVQPMEGARGYELILGSSVDSQLGPVILFGSGGQLAEVIADRELGLPPLTTTLARRMIEGTRAFRALCKPRWGKPADLAELEGVLVRFSRLVVEHPVIKEIEINPLLAKADGYVALDARVILHEAGEELARPAIRPYPQEYSGQFQLRNGETVTIRPIRPEDEPQIAAFHETLSEETVYYRYFHPQKLSRRVAHSRLRRTCFLDYDREIALVAVLHERGPEDGPIIGVGRLSRVSRGNVSDFALVLSDSHHGKGLGSELLRRLIRVAQQEGIARLRGVILTENLRMQRVAKSFGFALIPNDRDTYTAELAVDQARLDAVVDHGASMAPH